MRFGELKARVRELEAEVARLKQSEREVNLLESKLSSFFTGDVPQHATFDHIILAKYGRLRLTERTKQAALLTKTVKT